MNKVLDQALSAELAQSLKSKAKTPFENACKAALATEGAVYVQGFLAAAGKPRQPIEHAWIEVGDRIIDPTLPHLKKRPEDLHYFAAQRLSVKKLKAILEESKEDYPEDDPLPIYGPPPYEYYGDVMLGGQDYVDAHKAAQTKCKELNQRKDLEN